MRMFRVLLNTVIGLWFCVLCVSLVYGQYHDDYVDWDAYSDEIINWEIDNFV